MEILFKERVVGSNARESGIARKPRTRVVRDERRVDVHKIYVPSRNTREDTIQIAPTHSAVFRILRYTG